MKPEIDKEKANRRIETILDTNSIKYSNDNFKYMVFPGNNPEAIVRALEDRSNFNEVLADENSDLSEINFVWKPTTFSKQFFNKVKDVNNKRRLPLIINHIENFRTIPTKPGLYKSLKSFYNSNNNAILNKYTIHDSMPTSFFILIGSADDELNLFINRFREISTNFLIEERMPLKHCLQNLWLFKPANWNQGRGIEVFRSLQELKQIMNSKPENSFWVIQKYLERPLLYNDRKFDFRVWVLVNDSLDIFFYKFGYIRTSSELYSLETNHNYVHLTNNCLQKHGKSYGIHEEGNTASFNDFKLFLEKEYNHYNINFEKAILQRMKDLIIDSLLSARTELISKKKNYHFELLGYDFMIDEDFRVWIIEINTNPYIGVPNEYIAGVMPNMINNLIEIALDHHYPAFRIEPKVKDSDFDLIYCEKGSIFHVGPLNKRTPFEINNVYPISQLKPKNYKIMRKNLISPIILKKKQRKKSLKSEIFQQDSKNVLAGTNSECLSPSNTFNYSEKEDTIYEKVKDALNNIKVSALEKQLKNLQSQILTLSTLNLPSRKSVFDALELLSESKTYLTILNPDHIISFIGNCLKIAPEIDGFLIGKLISNIIFEAIEESSIRKCIFESNFILHSFMDMMLRAALKYSGPGKFFLKHVAQKFISLHRNKSIYYIPGETSEYEFQKRILIGLGSPLLSINIAFSLNCEEISTQFREHIHMDYNCGEISHIHHLLSKFLLENKFCIGNRPIKTSTYILSPNSDSQENHKRLLLLNQKNDISLVTSLNLSLLFKKALNFAQIEKILNDYSQKMPVANSSKRVNSKIQRELLELMQRNYLKCQQKKTNEEKFQKTSYGLNSKIISTNLNGRMVLNKRLRMENYKPTYFYKQVLHSGSVNFDPKQNRSRTVNSENIKILNKNLKKLSTKNQKPMNLKFLYPENTNKYENKIDYNSIID